MALNEAPIAIIGGGITGLAAAHALRKHLPADQIVLVERSNRLGGKIQTEHTGGFVIEEGPDSFLTTKPGALELCRELGLSGQLVPTLPATHRSYVRRHGRLFELPEGISGLIPSRLAPLLSSPLLSLRGRARVALDLVRPAREGNAEESIADFVRRRLGREAYDWLVEPLLSGIYAGDGTQLSLDATFPQLHDIERTRGSLIRGTLRQPRQPAAARSPFLAPREGMDSIVRALESHLAGCTLTCGRTAISVDAADDAYVITFADGAMLQARAVLLATPAFLSARLVAGLDAELGERLRGFPFVSTTTVALGYPDTALPQKLRGYGYLRPRAEGGPIVACTWVSSKWPGRAPEGQTLLRAFVGRAGYEEAIDLTDDDLLGLVREELREVLGIVEPPTMTRIHRWPLSMPQYTLGHGYRLARTEERVAMHPGLAIAGHSYHGIGIPDCIRSGQRAARQLMESESAIPA
ncbi:MAG: protoporphyrinogen oxidase [Gemmatimonadota bacterium]